jgi:drug/metabolite transporter (DMT)-like permease
VIASAAPAFAAYFSWLFLGERISRSTWLAAGSLFVGLAVVLSGSLTTGNIVGDVFALAYAVWLANYFVALRSCSSDSLFPIVACGGILSALLAAPMASPLSITPGDLALLAGLGVLILPLSILLLAFGTRYIPAPDVVMIMMLEAVLGPLWVWLVLGEVPSPYTVAGGGVILITIVIHAHAELSERKPVGAT